MADWYCAMQYTEEKGISIEGHSFTENDHDRFGPKQQGISCVISKYINGVKKSWSYVGFQWLWIAAVWGGDETQSKNSSEVKNDKERMKEGGEADQVEKVDLQMLWGPREIWEQ